MGGSDNKVDGLASQPRRYRVPGQPLLNRHQVGGVSRSPDGLFAQQEREPIRGRPAVRGKRTYGGRPEQRVEEQGTWASRTQKQSEAGYRRPVDRGAWTAKTVKRPRQQPAHPQYANYLAPLTRKRHTMPHSAQPQHTNYWAPRTGKRHQQEHRPQRRAERSAPPQHAKGRTGDCPGPRKGTTTRRNVTQGGMSIARRLRHMAFVLLSFVLFCVGPDRAVAHGPWARSLGGGVYWECRGGGGVELVRTGEPTARPSRIRPKWWCGGRRRACLLAPTVLRVRHRTSPILPQLSLSSADSV